MKKTLVGRFSTVSVLCHHFGWELLGSAKRRFDEGCSKEFQPRLLDCPHGGQTKKHSLERLLRGLFHATILGGLFQAAQKAGLTKAVQLRSKRVFSTCPIGAKRKNILAIEFHEVGFIPPFWVGFSKQRKKPG